MEAAFLVTSFKFCKDGFIIRLPGCHDMKENPGEFMGSVLDGPDSAVTCTLRTIIVAQIGAVVVERLSSESKLLGDAVRGFDFRSADATAGTGTVLGTYIEPRAKTFIGSELRQQIDAEFTKDGLNAKAFETGNARQINAENTFQVAV